MIDDKQLLWDRLKETAQDSLAKDMEIKIGQLFDKHKQEINGVLYDYISWALTRFSTTEIRKSCIKLSREHKGLRDLIDYETINSLDEWLQLDSPSILHNKAYLQAHIRKMGQHPLMNHNTGNPFAVNIGTTMGTSKNLKDLLRKLKPADPRRMRRLKRKETKLKKKGVRLFDSED